MSNGPQTGTAGPDALLLGAIREHDRAIADAQARLVALERSGPELSTRLEARMGVLEAQQEQTAAHLAQQDSAQAQFSGEVKAQLQTLLLAEERRQAEAAEQRKELRDARAEWRKSFYLVLGILPGLTLAMATYLRLARLPALVVVGTAIGVPVLVLVADWIRARVGSAP